MYVQRYFVLAFGNSMAMGSSTNSLHSFPKSIELRIFKKCIQSAWGNVPLGVTQNVCCHFPCNETFCYVVTAHEGD